MLGNKNDKKGIFGQIDDFFNSKKSSEATLIYLGVVVAIGYAVYSLIFPITDSGLKRTESKIADISGKISKEKSYLNTHTEDMIKKSRQSLNSKKVEYDNTIYKMSYVDNKLTELSYLLFDDQSWANFVDDISSLAKKYGVTINEITNTFYEPTYQKITHVAEIDIKSSSNLKNMMKFLNAIEESQLVIDVNQIELQRPEDDIEGNFKIAVWGMKY